MNENGEPSSVGCFGTQLNLLAAKSEFLSEKIVTRPSLFGALSGEFCD